MPVDSRIVIQRQKDGLLEIVPFVAPDPGPHEVMVEILATGVCQSQVFWMGRPRTQPILFGHEGYGVVRAIGSEVEHVSVGQYALVTWLPRKDPSGRQAELAEATLPDGTVGWSPNVYTWADHAVVDELYVYPLDGPADPEISVAACAVLTGAGSVQHAPVTLKNAQVAVIGAGGVGLSAIAAARAAGAEKIFAIDLAQDKLDFAKTFGATDTFNARELSVTEMLERMDGRGCDLVVDCVATGATIQQAIDLTRATGLNQDQRSGVAMIVGLPKGPDTVDLSSVVFGQKTVIGSLAGGSDQSDLATYLQWNQDGTLDLTELVTNRYPFDQVQAAVDDLTAGRVRGRSILTR